MGGRTGAWKTERKGNKDATVRRPRARLSGSGGCPRPGLSLPRLSWAGGPSSGTPEQGAWQRGVRTRPGSPLRTLLPRPVLSVSEVCQILTRGSEQVIF